MRFLQFTPFVAAAVAVSLTVGAHALAQSGDIFSATLMEANSKTSEVSTDELKRTFGDGSAIIIDARPRTEYEAGHIPGAVTIDAPSAEQHAAVERLVNGNKAAALVVYCNGPYCQASRRLAEQLATAGFTNVRRYQLGMPIWRALGGPTVMEFNGIARIFNLDRTAVYIDARSPEEFAKGSLPGARNVTAETLDVTIKEMMTGKTANAPLPLDDFNRRIVLFGRDAEQVRGLANAMSKRPWHNVMYFAGSYDQLAAGLQQK